MSSSRTIGIPVRNSDNFVEIAVDELPNEVGDIIDILKQEIAPLNIWLQIALEYYRQKREQQFEEILLEATQPGMEEKYAEQNAERIQILNTLAGFYIGRAERELDEKLKQELLSKSDKLITTATSIDRRNLNKMTFVTRGVSLLIQGDYDRAEFQFDTALDSNSQNITALLGKACIFYNRQRFSEALDCYKNILQLNPNCSANIRLGVGLCQYRLGRLDTARKAFERVLALDPNNVNALVALAVMDINTGDKKKIQDAMVHGLRKAATIDPKNSMVLNYFAKYFVYGKKDLKKAQSLANDAFSNTLVNEIRAESCYYRALAYHEEQNYDMAYKYYHQSVQLWSEFPLARYGLGQMHVNRNEVDLAIKQFNAVLQHFPESCEVHKVLGSLQGQRGKLEKALEHLRRAHELDAKDYEVLIEIAQYEQNAQAALDSLRKAQILLEEKKVEIPQEFWNNMGALNHKTGRFKEAEEFYLKSLAMLNGSLDSFTDEHVTHVFNVARLYEDSKRVEQAKQLYLQLVKLHPSFFEVYMRLAMLEYVHSNDIAKAIEWCTVMSHIKPKDPIPHALVGYFYLMNDQPNEAQKKLEYTFGVLDRHHAFTLLSLAAIFFNGIRPNEMNAERIERHLLYTQQYLEKAIKADKHNEFAALNMGALIAEMGYLEEAKDIFLKVRDLNPDIQETNINLAHISLCQNQYDMAIKSYERVLCKAPAIAVQQQNITKQYKVLLFLARTYFDANRLDESEETLNKAIALAPTKQVLVHDLAIVQFEQCTKFLKERVKLLEAGKKALTAIYRAKQNFDQVAQQKGKEDLQARAKVFAAKCQDLEAKVVEYIQQAEDDLKKEAEKKEVQRKALESKNAEKLKKEELERAALREKEEQQRKIQEELRLKREELISIWEKEQPKKKKRSGKKGDDDYDDADDGNTGADAESATPKKKKKSKKRKATSSSADGSASPSSSAPTTPKKNKKKSKLKRNADDDEEEVADKMDEDEEKDSQKPSNAAAEETADATAATAEGEAEFEFDNEEPQQQQEEQADGGDVDNDDEPKAKKQKTE